MENLQTGGQSETQKAQAGTGHQADRQAHHTGYRKMLQCTSMKSFVPSVLMTQCPNDKFRDMDMLRHSTDKGCMGLMYSRGQAQSH